MPTLTTALFALFAFALVYAIAFALSVYYAWVLSILWGWFIVPLGGHPLSVVNAIGLTIVVGVLTQGLAKLEVEGPKKNATLIGLLVGPLLALLFGYVVHCFM
jgi:hypothetical protein